MVLFAVAGCVDEGVGQAGSANQPIAPAKPAEVSDDAGGLQGFVLNEEALPVEGAIVAIPAHNLSTTADASGRYSLSLIPPGKQNLFVSALGYESLGRSVDIVAGNVQEITFQLVQVGVVEWFPDTKVEAGNIQCSVRAYPGVPTGGVGGLPMWVTGVAVCGAVSPPTSPPDRFLINFNWKDAAQEVLLEMEWKSTQTLGKELGVPLEHQGHPNDAKFTFGV
ncbi:MAG TPA: carboxypeptidase regulatory-like domain-containing protein, partial [Candidatus Thermoplasmatota archaeon]|nr:carboxypeptidase regulatory-like domain-containing protein [Candidatus Thermoplasmatota archaeon]